MTARSGHRAVADGGLGDFGVGRRANRARLDRGIALAP